ncbi:K Homology domain, type 1 [Dillenia turbinata]|uniref:K Homology domain, type 1 n=1 Tax=Dillenia turbinata TaxID=194707 RepID=A0AAN8Z7J7_9MAGN
MSSAEADTQQQGTSGGEEMEATLPSSSTTKATVKWPGWPGDNVFRLIVPVLKVGSIIGRKGELVKKMCEDTRARIRILDAPLGTSDRIVLISGKEELDSPLSPAMDAVIRVFKRVIGLSLNEDDGAVSEAASVAFCSMRMVIAASQGMHLIGKQGSTIKSIQEGSGASVRILPEDDLPSYASSDERIVELHGESLKVLKALELVLGVLRKFLVDHSVIPIFEKTYSTTLSNDHVVDSWADKNQSLRHPAAASQAGIALDYSLPRKWDPLLFDRDVQLESNAPHSGLSLYAQDSGLGGLRSTGLGRGAAPMVTQVTQTMQIPLSYAEDIIGIGGANIGYIRRSSGAILTVQESRGLPDEITVEIKGSSSQVQMAQQLIQEFIGYRKEPVSSMYGKMDAGLNSYSHLSDTAYHSSSFPSPSLGSYGSSNLGGYSSYRY